jgi:hypothetical protein
MSSIKIRRAGFNDTLYSDEMFAKWFARYQAERLLPRLDGDRARGYSPRPTQTGGIDGRT